MYINFIGTCTHVDNMYERFILQVFTLLYDLYLEPLR